MAGCLGLLTGDGTSEVASETYSSFWHLWDRQGAPYAPSWSIRTRGLATAAGRGLPTLPADFFRKRIVLLFARLQLQEQIRYIAMDEG